MNYNDHSVSYQDLPVNSSRSQHSQQFQNVDMDQNGPMIYASSSVDMHNRSCSGRFWLIKDICGIICAIMTYFLIMYASFVVYFVILIPAIKVHPLYSVFNMALFLLLSSLAFLSHLRTMLTDPVSLCHSIETF